MVISFINEFKEVDLDGVIVYGVGYHGRALVALLDTIGIKCIACLDSNEALNNNLIWKKVHCYQPDLYQYSKDVPVIVSIEKEDIRKNVCLTLSNLGFKIIYSLNCDAMWEYMNGISDREYIEIRYYARCNGYLDLDSPKTYNEKLNWMKLYDRNPLYTKMVDKYEAKKIASEKIGEEHIIPLYSVWDQFDDIDFSSLPNQFVLKCTHDSGSIYVCKDKSSMNVGDVKDQIESAMNVNTFYQDREWAYKDMKPRIIAEKYIDSLGKPDSIEYKFTCFNGRVAFGTICRGIAHVELEKRTNDHFTREFDRIPFYAFYKNSHIDFEKPAQWDEMVEYAEILSQGIPQVRVDFYIVDGRVYFGETTFYTWSACVDFVPQKYDEIFGEMIDLSMVRK